MARVRITKIPKALSGLEIKMQPGLYGTNGNKQFSVSNYIEGKKIAQQPTDVRDTLQPVDRKDANLEAEKGETAMVNIDGIPAHFKIGGKRHSEGGTPLNLPDNSFIFSDTAKMKITDPIILAQFGMVPKKSGYTPADIAKKYDINKFRQVLADPNSEDVERKTAELMISNYNMKLAKLALLQESKKGFPQGIPVVAMPYVMATGMNPEELTETDTQGQEEESDEDMGVSRYGGDMVSQFPTRKYGGLPRAQTGTQKSSLSRTQLEDMQRTLLGQIEKLRANDMKIPDSVANAYDKVYKLLFSLGPDQTVNQSLTNDNSVWKNTKGTSFDPKTGQEIDPDELSYFNPAGMTKQLGKMKQYLGQDLWQGNPNDVAVPPANGYGKTPTANALAAGEIISKLNPYNVPSNGLMGAFDYAGNIINLPLSGINKLTTGKVGTTGNLYTDVLMDPLTYMGLAPAKWTAEAAIKYGPKVGSFIAKHGVKAAKFLGKYGEKGIDLIMKYGEKGIDWLVEHTPELIEKAGKALTSETAQNIGTSLIGRGSAGVAQEKKKDKKVEKLEEEIAKLKAVPTPNTVPTTTVLLPAKPSSKKASSLTTTTPQKFNWTN
jgi:hypothetical protein